MSRLELSRSVLRAALKIRLGSPKMVARLVGPVGLSRAVGNTRQTLRK